MRALIALSLLLALSACGVPFVPFIWLCTRAHLNLTQRVENGVIVFMMLHHPPVVSRRWWKFEGGVISG